MSQPIRTREWTNVTVPMVTGLAAGIAVVVIGWGPALRLWPLLLVPILLARFISARVAALAVIGLLTGVMLVVAIIRVNSVLASIGAPFELDYGESIIYDHAARVLRGEPMYHPLDRPPYAVAAYTPVYYWLAAGLRALFGPGFLPGRIATFVGGLAIAGLVGYLTARQTRSRWAGMFGGLLFFTVGFAWGAPRGDYFFLGDAGRTALVSLFGDFEPGYPSFASYKEDLVGITCSLAAIAALIGGPTTRRVVLSAILAALAILTKQTLVAASIAGFVWLWRSDRQKALQFAGVVLGVGLGTCLWLEITTGAFFANTIVANGNPMLLEVAASNFPALLRYEGGPALAAALFVTDRSRPRRDGTDLLVYFWLVSWLPLIALAKVGASYNHWVEFAAITAVLATLGVWRSLPRFHLWRVRALVPLAVLVITFVAVTPLVGPARMRPSLPAQPQPGPEFATVVQRVRSEPRAVLGVPLDVIALADRPILLEPYIFSILATQGRWDPAPLIRRICGGQVGLLFFFNPLEYGSGSFHGYSFWPPAVVKALQESMVFDSIQNYRYVYVPRSEPLAVPPGSQRACPA